MKVDLGVVLEKHKKWWLGEEGGELADLRGADLRDADLRDAYLCGAYLSGAYLRSAYLSGADLRVKTPPLNDHYFISEILLRASINTKQRSWAGLVRISLNWCWEDFKENCSKTMWNWAKKVLCEQWPEFEEKFKEV